jgi:hypothetical protein
MQFICLLSDQCLKKREHKDKPVLKAHIYLASKIVNIDLEVTIKVHALANFRSFTTCKGYVVKLCCLQKQFGLLKRT